MFEPYKTSFFACDNLFYVILEKEKKPSFPIASLKTGLGYNWADFKNKSIKRFDINMKERIKEISTDKKTIFARLKRGDLFLTHFHSTESHRKESLIYLKLPTNFFNEEEEDDESSLFTINRNDFFALNLCTGKPAFGRPVFFEWVQEMQRWPVHPVTADIKDIFQT